jgi:hypothetical protein
MHVLWVSSVWRSLGGWQRAKVGSRKRERRRQSTAQAQPASGSASERADRWRFHVMAWRERARAAWHRRPGHAALALEDVRLAPLKTCREKREIEEKEERSPAKREEGD